MNKFHVCICMLLSLPVGLAAVDTQLGKASASAPKKSAIAKSTDTQTQKTPISKTSTKTDTPSKAATDERVADHPVSGVILGCRSPYAMSGHLLSDEDLNGLFEAARWARSDESEAPCRFIYAKRNSIEWSDFYRCLSEKDQGWTRNAGALVAIVSKQAPNASESTKLNASFNAGAAWQNMALQGYVNGLAVQRVDSFDYKQAKEKLKIPNGYKIETIVAVGKPGRENDLPQEMRGENMKLANAKRTPIKDFVTPGTFEGTSIT